MYVIKNLNAYKLSLNKGMFFIRFGSSSKDDLTILYTIFDTIKEATSYTRFGNRLVVMAYKGEVSDAYYENIEDSC